MAGEAHIPINFTISADAWSEIDNIRADYDQKYPDKADVLMIAWGTTMLNNGRSLDGVVAGFYSTLERPFIERGIQYLDGREIVFFATSETMKNFINKNISFTKSQGFYLS